ncbi:MAG: efflux RND transporter periplasmic adaptor subunit [Hyphomicrobiales bacterium]|nr:efflux RND transporter periplasmic adaptor subunit [Hyphomicrobiales bacterium]
MPNGIRKRLRRPVALATLAVGAVALALSACGKPTAQSTSRAEHPVLVVTAHFAPAVAPRNLVGVIRARVESNLGFRVTGKIAQRLVDRGAVVKAGQPLAILDQTDWKLQLQQGEAALSAARASRDQAMAERDRVSHLRNRGWSTASDLDKASATADQAVGAFVQAERAVTLQQNALSYATLLADADGVVTATLAEPGQVVASGQAVVTLAHAGEPEADVSIPEALLERVRTGQATVTLWSQPDKVYAAKLRELTPSADPATRTYPARFTLDNPSDQIELGMSATVTIADASPSVARLPLGAILDDGKGANVFVIDPQTKELVRRPVVIAGYDAQDAIISSGLAEGDAVIALGVQKLHDGDAVRPVNGAGA